MNASTLRTALSEWLDRAAKGERIQVVRHGVVVAEIGPPGVVADPPRAGVDTADEPPARAARLADAAGGPPPQSVDAYLQRLRRAAAGRSAG